MPEALGEGERFAVQRSTRPPVREPAFRGLGRALRWLREKQGRKQYELARAAGITKAMLSAYENDKQRPTLDSLERLLEALEADLGTLFDTLQVVNERPAAMRFRDGSRPQPASSASRAAAVREILGAPPSGIDEEEAVGEMVEAYFRWLRLLRRQALSDAGGVGREGALSPG